MRLKKFNLNSILVQALEEDVASCDITSLCLIPRDLRVKAEITAKEPAVISGLEIAKACFKIVDAGLEIFLHSEDSKEVKKGKVIMSIFGKARSILSAERVSLNFLSHLSGVATLTKKYVKQVSGSGVKILDTRKTIPLLRDLEKYGVRCGGGFNHRINLSDLILIKDNHKKAAFKKSNLGLSDLIRAAKLKAPSYIQVEIEIETVDEFKQVIESKPDIVMLDNMNPRELKTCVSLRANMSPKTLLEASGGINLKNIKKISRTGVDFISIGNLTHSPKAIDFSLEISGS